MLLSVVIPAYNAERTIERCINSLICNPFNDYEIIIIDDGSTDNTGLLCDEIAKRLTNIKVIHQTNKGVSVARNVGLSKVQGKYIMFVDSDDYVSEDYFTVIYHSMEKNDCDLLIFKAKFLSCSVENADSDRQSLYESALTSKAILSLLDHDKVNSLCTKVFRREIIEKNSISFCEDLHISEDFNFVFCYLMCVNSISFIDKTLYYVDDSSISSLSRKYRSYLQKELIRSSEMLFRVVDDSQLDESLKIQLYRRIIKSFYRGAYSCCKELYKCNYTKEQLSSEIKDICNAYIRKDIYPSGLKNKIIAFPILMKNIWVIKILLWLKGCRCVEE